MNIGVSLYTFPTAIAENRIEGIGEQNLPDWGRWEWRRTPLIG